MEENKDTGPVPGGCHRAGHQGRPHHGPTLRGAYGLFQNCHGLEKMDLEECILVSGPLGPVGPPRP